MWPDGMVYTFIALPYISNGGHHRTRWECYNERGYCCAFAYSLRACIEILEYWQAWITTCQR